MLLLPRKLYQGTPKKIVLIYVDIVSLTLIERGSWMLLESGGAESAHTF